MVDEKFIIDEFKLLSAQKKDGVFILSEINDIFESVYLKVRAEENRIYSDDEVNKLPFASNSNPHYREWLLRTRSFIRFQDYLKTKNDNLNILDLGCGNGWLSGYLAKGFNHKFYCVDVNLTELKQGARVFKLENVKFVYANILNANFKANLFDLIILNASIQYFPEFSILFDMLLTILKPDGEINIIDSPFYTREQLGGARERTVAYYKSIGFLDMAKYYFHHCYEDLKKYKYTIMFNPNSVSVKLKRMLWKKDSPFPWIRLTR